MLDLFQIIFGLLQPRLIDKKDCVNPNHHGIGRRYSNDTEFGSEIRERNMYFRAFELIFFL